MPINVKTLEGNEIAANDYVRRPKSRGMWGHCWDVFKGNFFKTVLINIFTLIFFVPGIVIVIFRNISVQSLGLQAPVNGSIPFPVYPETAGLAEGIYLSTDAIFFSLLLIAGFIASVGVAGAAYSIKKMIATNGEFTIKGFFHGVKVGYFNTVLPLTIFLLFYISCVLIGDWKDLVIAQGGKSAGPMSAYVIMIIVTVIIGVYCAWLFAVGISYKVKFFHLFKNSFMLMIGSPVHTLFMSGFALIPVWLLLIGNSVRIIQIIGYIFFIFIGFTFILFSWLGFTQWVFDMYITPAVKAETERNNAKKTDKELAREKYEQDRMRAHEIIASGKSELIGSPIKPITEDDRISALGMTFTRSQLAGVEDRRKQISGDVEAYRLEHANDPEFVEYNRLFADHERALKENEGKKKNKKKISADNMLGSSGK